MTHQARDANARSIDRGLSLAGGVQPLPLVEQQAQTRLQVRIRAIVLHGPHASDRDVEVDWLALQRLRQTQLQ